MGAQRGRQPLAETHPEVAAQLWDEQDGLNYSAGSHQKVLWRCPAHPEHPFSQVIADRVRGIECGFCSGKVVGSGVNDLGTTHPDVAAQLWDPDDATRYTAGSNKKVLWKCPEHPEHPFTATVVERSTGDRGCGVCYGRQVAIGYNDLATTNPDLAAQLWDPQDAHRYTAGSSRSVRWRCEAHPDLPVTQIVKDRRDHGCGACAGRIVLAGFNDIATTHPELAAELADSELSTKLNAGSNRCVEWQCLDHAEHRWKSSPNTRTSMGTGCPYCQNRAVLAGYNDLATTHPDLAAQLADPTVAETITYGSGKMLLWKCENHPDHPYRMRMLGRSAQGQGCPLCSNKKVLAGVNDLGTTHPELAAELVNPDHARTVSYGSKRKLVWRCESHPDEPFTMAVKNRTQLEQGCPRCSEALVTSKAERGIADELEARGLVVDRQVSVGRFRIDIALPEVMLAVEYDGAYWHAGHEDHDLRKNQALEGAGWQVIRFRERARDGRELKRIGRLDRMVDAPTNPEELEQVVHAAADAIESVLARNS